MDEVQRGADDGVENGVEISAQDILIFKDQLIAAEMEALREQEPLTGLHEIRVGEGRDQHEPERPCVKQECQRHQDAVDAVENAVGAGVADPAVRAYGSIFHAAPPYQML